VSSDFEPEGGDSKSIQNISSMLFLSLVLHPEDVIMISIHRGNIKCHLIFTCPMIEAKLIIFLEYPHKNIF
jgi:hypothetical protein